MRILTVVSSHLYGSSSEQYSLPGRQAGDHLGMSQELGGGGGREGGTKGRGEGVNERMEGGGMAGKGGRESRKGEEGEEKKRGGWVGYY